MKYELLKAEFVNRREKQLQRKIWCTKEHWEKSSWKRIINLWARMKNEEKRTELLEKLGTEVMEEGMKAAKRKGICTQTGRLQDKTNTKDIKFLQSKLVIKLNMWVS